MQQTIPVLNLKHFLSGDVKQEREFAQRLGIALMEYGFFALENHGVNHELIKKSYKLCQAFFELPEEQKLRYERPETKFQRGFMGFGKEKAKDSNAPDLKEYWHVGRELPQDHELLPLYGENVWPEEITDFKESFLQLYQELDQCAGHLLRAVAQFLKEPEDRFSELTHDGNTVLRIIHYPPVPDDANPASIRAAAHDDINLLTLLCESTDEGLQLLQKDGTWLPIHALDGQIIVDSGDMMQNLTNGMIPATTHRVVNPDQSRSRRFSMPFFVHPNANASLEPLPKCVDQTGGDVLFPKLTAQEFLNKRLRENGLA